MKCNRCWDEFKTEDQAIATSCGHLFCIQCAKSIIESDGSCSICENHISKNNIKLVNILQEPSACKLFLCGQSPETALNSALAAVNFYLRQQELISNMRECQIKKKIEKVQEQCKKKLSEVHNGYQMAKRKYQEIYQQKSILEKDLQELQEKYSQKAMQVRKLQEMYKKTKSECDEMLRGRSSRRSQRTMLSRSGAFSPQNFDDTNVQLIKKPYINKRGHVSDKLFNLKDMSPSHIFKDNDRYQSVYSESNQRKKDIQKEKFGKLKQFSSKSGKKSSQLFEPDTNSLNHLFECPSGFASF